MKESAPELLSKAVESCLAMPELTISSPGTAGMKDQFQEWSRLILPDHDFAAKLVDLILKRVFTSKVKKSKSLSTRYERMWRCFHQFVSSSELTTLWMQGLGNPSTGRFFTLFTQAMTKLVLKEIIDATSPPKTTKATESPTLTESEEEAVRYVAGYVLMKLKKKYFKLKSSPEVIACFEFLAEMHVEEEEVDKEDDFLQYTKR